MRSQFAKAEQRPSAVRNLTESLRDQANAFERLSLDEQIKSLLLQNYTPRRILRKLGVSDQNGLSVQRILDVQQSMTDANQSDVDDELEYQLREEHFDKVPDSFTRIGMEV